MGEQESKNTVSLMVVYYPASLTGTFVTALARKNILGIVLDSLSSSGYKVFNHIPSFK